MNKKEIKAEVAELISGGLPKADVFAKPTGQGVKDYALARYIASYADPQRCRANQGHIRAVLVIAWLQVLIGVLVGFSIGSETSPLGGLIVGGLVAGFALLFVFGFSKNKAFAYNAYLILAITQIPRQFHGISEEPTSTMIGLAIGLALLGYIWYVRSRLFPDFTFLWPRKISGKYVFSDSPPGER